MIALTLMTVIEIPEAEAKLDEWIARAEAGEAIVIARDGIPVARLIPLARATRRPGFGSMKGIWPNLPDEFFFDPLPEEELRAWEGGDDEDTLP